MILLTMGFTPGYGVRELISRARCKHLASARRGRSFVWAVPELTRNAGIQLNERVWLRPVSAALRSSRRTLPEVRAHNAKSSGGPSPLGGYFGMIKPRRVSAVPDQSDFEIVCNICDGIGIIFDFAEDSPCTVQIKCRHCGAPRGTLGALRHLSASGKQDLFEV
jgi:hypothetical protein